MLRGFGALWAKAYEFETIRQGVPEAASCLEDLSRVKAGLSYLLHRCLGSRCRCCRSRVDLGFGRRGRPEQCLTLSSVKGRGSSSWVLRY